MKIILIANKPVPPLEWIAPAIVYNSPCDGTRFVGCVSANPQDIIDYKITELYEVRSNRNRSIFISNRKAI